MKSILNLLDQPVLGETWVRRTEGDYAYHIPYRVKILDLNIDEDWFSVGNVDEFGNVISVFSSYCLTEMLRYFEKLK